jgi:hypothetical protein
MKDLFFSNLFQVWVTMTSPTDNTVLRKCLLRFLRPFTKKDGVKKKLLKSF